LTSLSLPLKWIQCSTPYGIRGSVSNYDWIAVGHVRNLCSTPYGIRGSVSNYDWIAVGHVRNLCSTPYGIRGSVSVEPRHRLHQSKPGAQRLTASEDQSVSIRGTSAEPSAW